MFKLFIWEIFDSMPLLMIPIRCRFRAAGWNSIAAEGNDI